MIEINNVSKSYALDVKAVDDISLTIKDGEIFAFIGENGAGKSTTIHMMCGILKADNGTIKIDGRNIESESIEAKKHIGYVADSADYFLGLRAIDYLNLMADIYKVDSDERKDVIESLAKRFELSDNLGQRIESYSHGMRQKIMIIAALLSNPNNWILDEPMTGLDPKSSYELKEMMKEHAQNGHCVFFSTHVLEVAEKLCDRIGIIKKGKLLFVGTLDELKANYSDQLSLEDIFLEITHE